MPFGQNKLDNADSSPRRSKYPNVEASGPKHYTHYNVGTLYHRIWVLGPFVSRPLSIDSCTGWGFLCLKRAV